MLEIYYEFHLAVTPATRSMNVEYYKETANNINIVLWTFTLILLLYVQLIIRLKG